MGWIHFIKTNMNSSNVQLTHLTKSPCSEHSSPHNILIHFILGTVWPLCTTKTKVKRLVRQIWISGSSSTMMPSYFFKNNFYCVYLIWGFFQQACQLKLSPIAWTECIARATPLPQAITGWKVNPKSVIKIFIFLVTNTWKLEITT